MPMMQTRGRWAVGPKEVAEVDIHYVLDATELPAIQEWCLQQSMIGIDIETDGRSKDGLRYQSKKIATIQVGTPFGPAPRAYVICVRSVGDAALEPFLRTVAQAPVIKLGQNLGFELSWMGYKFGTQFEHVADTQLAELIIRAGLFSTNREKAVEGGGNRVAYGATSMAKLGKRYLGVEIEKGDDLRLEFWVTPPGQLSPAQLQYAAGDVVIPFYLLREQKKEIRQRGLSEIIRIEFALLPVLIDSTLYGIGLDAPAWRKLWGEAVQARADRSAELDAIFRGQNVQQDMFGADVRPVQGRKIVNYAAPDQVKDAIVAYCKAINWSHEIITTPQQLYKLKGHYGAEWLTKRNADEDDRYRKDADYVKRKYTNKDIPEYFIPENKYVILIKLESDTMRLAKIRKQLPANLVDAYLGFKEAAKRDGTYGIEFLRKHVQEDGRVHVYWNQAITSTGRLSSEPNTQNIPRNARYRACFTPKPGYKFVILDYSQIEPRLSAEASQDPVYLKTFVEGRDIYCSIGEAMTGQPIDKKTKQGKMMRQVFKALALALAYNMGVDKLRNALTLALAEYIESGDIEMPTREYAQGLLKGFFVVHGGIKSFQTNCIAVANPEAPSRPRLYDKYLDAAVTWVTALCGRKRFFAPDCLTTYTEAPNAPIQGCSATITKLAAVRIWERAREEGLECHFVNLVHDEVVIEVPEAQASALRDIAKAEMEAAAARYIVSVPVIAEFPGGTDGIVDCWLKEAA